MPSLEDQFHRHIAWTSHFPLGLEVERAEGPYLYLSDGRRVIDFISGIAVSSLGHRHPRVVEAIKKQVDRHLHVMVYGEFIQRPQVRLAALLAENLPEELSVAYFTMSGTEANEGALKLAKKRKRYAAPVVVDLARALRNEFPFLVEQLAVHGGYQFNSFG